MDEQSRWEDLVTRSRITLIDNKDEEYEFLILDEIEYRGCGYLALVSCDVKTDTGSGDDPGESNDIVVVRVRRESGGQGIYAVTDPDELYAISKIITDRYAHLAESSI